MYQTPGVFIRYPTLRSQNILNTKRGVKTLRNNEPKTRKSVSTDVQTLKSDKIINTRIVLSDIQTPREYISKTKELDIWKN